MKLKSYPAHNAAFSRGSHVVTPFWSTMTSGVTVAEEDMRGDSYFWEAPQVKMKVLNERLRYLNASFS